MINFHYLLRTLAMERIKIKNTLVPWLALFAPLFVVFVALVAAYVDGDRFYGPGINPWTNFSGHILVGWALFVYPVYVSLQSALYAAVEHQNRAFAYLYSQPIPKWSIYAGKFLVLTGLVGLSHFALYVFAETAGWLLGILKPGYGFQFYSMHRLLSQASILMFLTGGGMIVIQLYISIRFTSFMVPAGVGLFATMAGAISRGFSVSQVSPYLWPICFFNNSLELSDWRYLYLWMGLAASIVGAWVSNWLISKNSPAFGN